MAKQEAKVVKEEEVKPVEPIEEVAKTEEVDKTLQVELVSSNKNHTVILGEKIVKFVDGIAQVEHELVQSLKDLGLIK